MRRGEPLTDVRLVGSRLVDALGPGLVATPVRLADAAVAGLLRAGDRVDVLAAPADPALGTRTTVAAADVPVLAVPVVDATGDQGALIVLATTPRAAMTLAAAAGGRPGCQSPCGAADGQAMTSGSGGVLTGPAVASKALTRSATRHWWPR